MNTVLDEFVALVSPEIADENIDVLRAALTYARSEYPALDVEQYVARVDLLASRIRSVLPAEAGAHEILNIINRVLFEEEKFRGNRNDYYDPRNSYLNEVLDRRLGIPITLSVLYMEVARRVGVPVFGVGMPGHFLLKHYDVGGHETFIDPFSGGHLLNHTECEVRMEEVYGGQIQMQRQFLNSVRNRQILTRMLNNLRSVYISGRSFRKALTIVDFIVTLHPRSPEDIRQRALLRYNEGMLRLAAEDLDEYVRIAPDASDAEEMKETALSIRRSLAMMN